MPLPFLAPRPQAVLTPSISVNLVPIPLHPQLGKGIASEQSGIKASAGAKWQRAASLLVFG